MSSVLWRRCLHIVSLQQYPTSRAFLSLFPCMPGPCLAQRDIVVEKYSISLRISAIVYASYVYLKRLVFMVQKSLVRISRLQIEACFEAFRAGCKDVEFPTGVFKLHETCSSTYFSERHHPVSLHTPSCWCFQHGSDGNFFPCKSTGSDTASFAGHVGCSKLVYFT